MWAQIYDIIILLLFCILIYYRLVKHKEKIKKCPGFSLLGQPFFMQQPSL